MLDSKVVHGRVGVEEVLNYFYSLNSDLPVVKIQKNLHVLSLIDKDNENFKNLPIAKSNIFNKENFHLIIIDEFNTFYDKAKSYLDYIEANYDNLGDYIFCVDSLDAVILNDLVNIENFLDYYNCKVIFNAEPEWCGTSYVAPYDGYLDTYFNQDNIELTEFLNFNKFGSKISPGLNAGVFLGEKDEILKMLRQICTWAEDDIEKKFPYGCTDDQYLIYYYYLNNYDVIGLDIFNLFFLYTSKYSFDENLKSVYEFGYYNYYHNLRVSYESKKASKLK